MRRKTTVYVDETGLRATQIAAARTGRRDYQVVEDALRSCLGMELLNKVGQRSNLDEAEALKVAYRETHRSPRS
jgi:hypothetical protein